MRTLVVSGGGSKLPFGIGCLEELQRHYDYTTYIGISAGGIISLFGSCNKLNELYDSVCRAKLKDVFNKSPVTKKGNISFFAKIRILLGDVSLGQNRRFKAYIKKYISQDDYIEMKKTKEVRVGVSNFNSMMAEYKSSKDYDFEEFLDWCVISTNIPIVIEPVKMGNSYYFDGGVIDYVGLDEAMKLNRPIDAIMHSPVGTPTDKDRAWKPSGIVDVFLRMLTVMDETVAADDIEIGKEKAKNLGIKLNIFTAPCRLTDKSYVMDVKLFEEWRKLGKETVRKQLGV